MNTELEFIWISKVSPVVKFPFWGLVFNDPSEFIKSFPKLQTNPSVRYKSVFTWLIHEKT